MTDMPSIARDDAGAAAPRSSPPAADALAGRRLDEVQRELAAELAAARGMAFPAAALDVRVLLREALRITDAALIAAGRERLSPAGARRMAGMFARRLAGEPVSRIIGRREFWGREFLITPAVLDPRPETETLIATALRLPPLPGDNAGSAAPLIVDAGAGSGAIIVTLLAEVPAWRGIALDISEAALGVTMRNACRHGVARRLVARRSDWLGALDAPCHLLVSNPPYVTTADFDRLMPEVRDHDPRIALLGGDDGLRAYRRLAVEAAGKVLPGGFVLLETGAGQAPAVEEIFAAAGFVPHAGLPHRITDLSGIERAVLLQKR